MARENFCVARAATRTRASVGKFERHIERKNENYENMNVDLSRTPMNVCFKSCGDMTYNEYLDKLVADGMVSLRGLKTDAKVFDEVILDVNTDYFEQNGGYEYACRFYEEAFHFAEQLYGKQNIVSAVMHADELNTAMTEKYGKPVYHYHLHVVALPVVDKEVKWTKRCKDPALVGTVKDVIHQVSHSKKWKSEKMLDEDGKPVLNSKGKPVYRTSYSILQDRFFEHMCNAGYTGFQRGERGSATENLSVLDFKIQQDQKTLSILQRKIQDTILQADDQKKVFMSFTEIERSGKKGMLGKYTLNEDDYKKLTALAKRSYAAESEAKKLRQENQSLKHMNSSLQQQIGQLKSALAELSKRCKPYLEALRYVPKAVKDAIDRLTDKVRREQRDIMYAPADVGTIEREVKARQEDAR